MSERQHFATLDGLRGIAAIVVVTRHVLHPFDITLSPHSALAVDFFFCLSGFVIGYAYENRLLLGAMSFGQFVVARIIRLYPLILGGLLLGAVVYVVRATALHHQSPFTPNFLIALISEALLVPIPPILGDDWPEITPFDTPAWSLFFEVFANFAYALFVTRLTKPPVMTSSARSRCDHRRRPSLCFRWRHGRGKLAQSGSTDLAGYFSRFSAACSSTGAGMHVLRARIFNLPPSFP